VAYKVLDGRIGIWFNLFDSGRNSSQFGGLRFNIIRLVIII
jgi:hypothetical protein